MGEASKQRKRVALKDLSFGFLGCLGALLGSLGALLGSLVPLEALLASLGLSWETPGKAQDSPGEVSLALCVNLSHAPMKLIFLHVVG